MERTEQQERIAPEYPRRCFSGSVLKLIAVVSMLIDHTAAHILYGVPAESQVALSLFGHSVLWYDLMRGIGRLAFPIFCFLLTEGFQHTRNRRQYGRNLLLFALVSEPIWDLLHFRTALYIGSQNVLFTLFLGFLGLCALDRPVEIRKKLLALGWLTLAASALHADYGMRGFILVALLYALRTNHPARALSVCGLLSASWPAWLAILPIELYSGERGFLHGRIGKYAFYLVYPVHLAVLYVIKYHLL